VEEQMTTLSQAHDRATQRLTTALAEQDRLSRGFEAAAGTPGEFSAGVALYAADEQVMARDAWLKWVDDEGYHGLNAGPFALRRELEHALGPIG
jgi:hypothetical protein